MKSTPNHLIGAIVFTLLPMTLIAQPLLQQRIDQNWLFRQQAIGTWHPATVPGTVHTDLLDNGMIEDPFFRTNEQSLQWIDKVNWEYKCTFRAGEELTNKEIVNLVFKGLDTYASVYLNSEKIMEANNMHRTWRTSIKNKLKPGENELHIIFDSPIMRGLDELNNYGLLLPASNDQSENGGMGKNRVSVFTRKAGYHYGWDWGPRFVTSGIWRDVVIEACDQMKIEDLYIKQDQISKKEAHITAKANLNNLKEGSYQVKLVDLQANKTIQTVTTKMSEGDQTVDIPVILKNPRLWWPAGMGDQNLYRFEVQIFQNNLLVASKTTTSGLRTIELVREKDAQGESFYFKVNGIPVFAKGANYIPNDSFLPRVSRADYEKVVADAVDANMNMLRIWGGGIYEDDYFYELCDRNGILVWQDFMFACSMYPGNEAFLKNAKAEVADNVTRLRNHPCIALWCGNNEINTAWNFYGKEGWGWKQQYTPEQQQQINEAYLAIFHEVIPSVLKNLSHDIAYWPSSPQAGYEPQQHASYETTSGDMHYWGVWHGLHPFSDFDKYKARFMSECGFQSFPEFETVKRYAIPEDFDIESTVMSAHQRSGIGNLRIREYMGWDYQVPADFEQFLYMSQVLQAKGIKAAIEAHRRARPYCMGTLYWQINDCWPVASWSSTDYYHNWKAMHYMARKAFAPVTISLVEEDNQLKIHAISDKLKDFKSTLTISLIDFNGQTIKTTTQPVSVKAATSEIIKTLAVDELIASANRNQLFLKVTLTNGKKIVAQGLHYFELPKNMALEQSEIKTEVTASSQGMVSIKLTSDKLVKDLMLSIPGQFTHFSDNYFDLLPEESVTVTLKTDLTAEQVKSRLRLRHLIGNKY
ncbi:MAG: glycoside hydrolase family 2 protein [Breznakibacter sp.]|nr:glycoside hydrolase family 2 protein [Breznakibacter sp.]